MNKNKKIIIIIGIIVLALILVIISVFVILKIMVHNIPDDSNMEYGNTFTAPDGHEVIVGPPMSKKPVIYLYPETTTDVTVTLEKAENITCSYPKYESNWIVNASPDGTLLDLKTSKKLYSLYYEANVDNDVILDEGFVVSKENIASFLEEKLEILGLNYKEKEEFIIYWLPILEANDYTAIKFLSKEEIANIMPLDIEPKPDTTIRILMAYTPAEENTNLEEQTLIPVHREGFVAVEWGAMRIK